MDARVAVFVLLHAMGSTAGLLALFHTAQSLTGREATAAVRRDYAVGGLLVVVGLGLWFLLAPTTTAPDAVASLPASVLRPTGLLLAALGGGGCLWALWRLRADTRPAA